MGFGDVVYLHVSWVAVPCFGHDYGHRLAPINLVGDEGATGDVGGHELPDGS